MLLKSLRKGVSPISFSKSISLNLNNRLDGSVRSGSGAGSVVTSLSDLERIEKMMNHAQFANKNIIKYFGKHIEDFRKEQSGFRDFILTEFQVNNIPQALHKQASVNMAPNHFSKNF